MSGKITSSGLKSGLLRTIYSPTLQFKTSFDDFENLYCFLAKSDPWPDENNPDAVSITDVNIKKVYKNIIALKQINSTDICPIVQRINWTSGITYTSYSDNVDLGTLNADGSLVYYFYAKNKLDQVFKCIYNGTTSSNLSGIPSTAEPIIDFSIETQNLLITTSDGYIWQYLYTISSGDKLKFMDDSWMPVSGYTNRSQINSVGGGEITAITVYSPGINYSQDSGTGVASTITITGDGSGATAVAVANNGVQNIIVTNPGVNYTQATAAISPNLGYTGSGAILNVALSPVGGHGYDILSELKCRNVIVTAAFNNSENNNVSTNIHYRQIGLIRNPSINIGSNQQYANSYIMTGAEIITLSSGFGSFSIDETVYQGDSLVNATFKGTVMDFDSTNNLLYVINTTGTVTTNSIIKGYNSNAVRVVLIDTGELYSRYSGDIIYFENRKKVQRNSTSSEQFRLIIGF